MESLETASTAITSRLQEISEIWSPQKVETTMMMTIDFSPTVILHANASY